MEGKRSYTDYSYGDEKRQALDLHLPAGKRGETGLVFFIHGGGWVEGDKAIYRDELRKWSEKGYAAAAANYRYVSETIGVQDILDDITAALSAVRTLGLEQGLNLNKCLLTGGSAGGHLALLYAYSQRKTAPVTPVCVVDYCGPAALDDTAFALNEGWSPWIQTVLSHCCGKAFTAENFADAAQALKKISPVTYALNAVPTVMAYGKADDIVPFSQAEVLDRALTHSGVPHDLVIYPNSRHDLASDPDADAETARLFERCAAKYLN